VHVPLHIPSNRMGALGKEMVHSHGGQRITGVHVPPIAQGAKRNLVHGVGVNLVHGRAIINTWCTNSCKGPLARDSQGKLGARKSCKGPILVHVPTILPPPAATRKGQPIINSSTAHAAKCKGPWCTNFWGRLGAIGRKGPQSSKCTVKGANPWCTTSPHSEI